MTKEHAMIDTEKFLKDLEVAMATLPAFEVRGHSTNAAVFLGKRHLIGYTGRGALASAHAAKDHLELEDGPCSCSAHRRAKSLV
jgi:hypothetical protein